MRQEEEPALLHITLAAVLGQARSLGFSPHGFSGEGAAWADGGSAGGRSPSVGSCLASWPGTRAGQENEEQCLQDIWEDRLLSPVCLLSALTRSIK